MVCYEKMLAEMERKASDEEQATILGVLEKGDKMTLSFLIVAVFNLTGWPDATIHRIIEDLTCTGQVGRSDATVVHIRR